MRKQPATARAKRFHEAINLTSGEFGDREKMQCPQCHAFGNMVSDGWRGPLKAETHVECHYENGKVGPAWTSGGVHRINGKRLGKIDHFEVVVDSPACSYCHGDGFVYVDWTARVVEFEQLELVA